ncbi:MAG TPA: hypothetical protein VJ813_02565 [Vicinamibacterales bacterium]|nr:hypothetical protein [Vicinamibacterales bacterium]
MRKGFIVFAAAAALAAPLAAGAQSGGAAVTSAEQSLVAAQATAGGRGRGMAAAVETKITLGRPYSAEATNETVQTLSDGNRINRRSVTRVYRDGEGRTRREMLADDGSVRSISISDPVAHTSYTLDPKAKVAYKAGGNIVLPMGLPPSSPSVVGGRGASARPRVVDEAATAGRGGGGGGTMVRTPAPDNPNVKKEELGPQNIEGVMATGTRTTTTIPAGEIGNAQEIRVVSEQWFSDDLQVLVMTRHSDPRSGETTYRLRNILRAEPDQTLFTVPTDYTIQQRGVRQPQ